MANQYQPQNILITGGFGFIGSHVVIELAQKYPSYKLVVLDKLDYCASRKNLTLVEGKYTAIIGNILSAKLVRETLKKHQIDTIMHFAAQSHVDNSFGNSIEFTNSNIVGTHILLEAARYHKIKRFIHVSTDEVYGETSERMKEDMVLEPTNPYAATKAGAELLVKSYHRSFNLPVIITRGNNVYGPHQYPEKLIPKFINLLEKDQPCPIHGDGSNTRSFLYVTDVARAFVLLLHKGKVGQVYNIGTNFEISNFAVAKYLIKQYFKSAKKYIVYVEDRKFNDSRYWVDTKKMEALGWKPSVLWGDGIKNTIQWYRIHPDHWDHDISIALTAHPTRPSFVGKVDE